MLILLLPVILPVLFGVLLFAVKGFDDRKKRNMFTGAALIISAAVTLCVVFCTEGSLTLWKITESASITLKCDGLTRFFAVLMSLMWNLVGFYAFDYMKHEEDEKRFFAFYLIVMGVLSGIYMSANLITLYLFYELMTLTSLPLVLHSLTKEAISAGKKYLFYSVGGAFLSLISIFYIYTKCSVSDFTAGGFLGEVPAGDKNMLLVFVFLAIIGFGCKAGLFPLQDWLPTAHPVAPSPASAVLSGVITKSGVFVIIRLIFYSIGADFIRDTWVQYAWMGLSLLTVFLGSMMAYNEKVMKKRFAYSTVSQVSYVLFGLSVLSATGMKGALLHVIFHSVIKDGLFLVAGAIIVYTGIKNVDELKGIAKRMPTVIWCFTFFALALVGIPPASGFVSKWFLCLGALEGEIGVFRFLGPAILLISALLTAGYLLPITIHGFFPGNDFDYGKCEKCKVSPLMIVPLIILAVAAVGFGLFPDLITNGIESITGALF
ncbi:MAG: membrane-associated sensor domain-containing protein [Lachnospiraceae bacterium]|nr:membrane-associated sensor domain-containing protein [Lachnospiraceae bacterium]MBR4145574.1 membrane-associated sensor domain-containing protein [Lachnospiraceae bacterium]MBR6473901.1 membrane-associated sensor domain-containing protein [Lachnospiraceae bacterium]